MNEANAVSSNGGSTGNNSGKNIFDSYPTHRVCAIFESSADARPALDGLLAIGVKREDIEILGRTDSGDLGPVVNTTHGMGDVEDEAFGVYQSALEKGNYVFAVLAKSDDVKTSVSEVLIKNNAHYVNYFGSLVVEGL